MTPAERAKVFKALSDPHRLAIVEHLAKGSQCGSTLAEALGISASLLSHHWEILVRAGVLNKERVGQLRVCSLNSETLREAMTMNGAFALLLPSGEELAAASAPKPSTASTPKSASRPASASAKPKAQRRAAAELPEAKTRAPAKPKKRSA